MILGGTMYNLKNVQEDSIEFLEAKSNLMGEVKDLTDKITNCILEQVDVLPLKINWIDLENDSLKNFISGTRKRMSHKNILDIPRNNRGWYFFVNKHTDCIDYIGIGGTQEILTTSNDLYHRVSQHLCGDAGSNLAINYYKSLRTIIKSVPKEEKRQWVKVLHDNYHIMIIYTDSTSISRAKLIIVESFLISLFQPLYNRD